MLSFLPCVLLSMSVVILPHQPNVKADGACTEVIRTGYRLVKLEFPAKTIGGPITGVDQTECFSRCCAAEGCNIATHFRTNGNMVCLLAQCTPMASCKWGLDPAGSESIAAEISPRADWGAIAEAATTEAPEITTESIAAEASFRQDSSQISVPQTSNATAEVNADIFVENVDAEAQTTTAHLQPLVQFGQQQPVLPEAGVAPVAAPAANLTGSPVANQGLFAGGVENIVQSTAAPVATTTESDNGWDWMWPWASATKAPTKAAATTSTLQAAETTQGPHLNSGYVFPNSPAWVPTGSDNSAPASLPVASIDSSHNPIGTKQNSETPLNGLGKVASNPAIPVYDSFGNPVPVPAAATTEQPVATGGGGWNNWWGSSDTETESPLDQITSSNEDDWDKWLEDEEKNEDGKHYEDMDNEEEGEEAKEDVFGNSLTDHTPGVSQFGENDYPSVQKSGPKLVSSEAHKHPMTESSFFNANLAVRNANRPIIVAGLCSLIVMVMLVMFFMARKTCQEKDRSRYRPLRDESFNEIAYHDHPSP